MINIKFNKFFSLFALPLLLCISSCSSEQNSSISDTFLADKLLNGVEARQSISYQKGSLFSDYKAEFEFTDKTIFDDQYELSFIFKYPYLFIDENTPVTFSFYSSMDDNDGSSQKFEYNIKYELGKKAEIKNHICIHDTSLPFSSRIYSGLEYNIEKEINAGFMLRFNDEHGLYGTKPEASIKAGNKIKDYLNTIPSDTNLVVSIECKLKSCLDWDTAINIIKIEAEDISKEPYVPISDWLFYDREIIFDQDNKVTINNLGIICLHLYDNQNNMCSGIIGYGEPLVPLF